MAERKLTLRGEFDKALAEHAGRFGVALDVEAGARLGDYFELVMRWNPRLHLVAPCAPAEFAIRHVLESLLALRFVERGATVVDVGSGAGLPVLPCLAVRDDLKAVLIEASRKKAVFLREALAGLGRREAATVVAERFEKVEPISADVLTCRAVERFESILPALVSWASGIGTLLLFGGPNLRAALESLALDFTGLQMPGSERRFLFVVRRVRH